MQSNQNLTTLDKHIDLTALCEQTDLTALKETV